MSLFDQYPELKAKLEEEMRLATKRTQLHADAMVQDGYDLTAVISSMCMVVLELGLDSLEKGFAFADPEVYFLNMAVEARNRKQERGLKDGTKYGPAAEGARIEDPARSNSDGEP